MSLAIVIETELETEVDIRPGPSASMFDMVESYT